MSERNSNPRAMRDETGKRYGKLLVLSRAQNRNGAARFLCQCDCGRQIEVFGFCLRKGQKSCVCGISESNRSRTRHGHARRSTKATTEFNLWHGIIQRCTNPNVKAYPYYGGRGIAVCDRWLSFDIFLADVGLRPGPEYTLDRYPNNDGNYEPGNVRWATRKQQMQNTRRNRLLSLNGTVRCLSEWVELLGVKQGTLIYQLKKHDWNLDRVVALRKIATPSS